MSANSLLAILTQSIGVIPLFLVTVGCVLLLTRAYRGAAIAMLIGNLIMIAVTLLHAVVTAMIMTNAVSNDVYRWLGPASQILSLSGGVLFGVGFLMMALKAQGGGPRMSPPPLGAEATPDMEK